MTTAVTTAMSTAITGNAITDTDIAPFPPGPAGPDAGTRVQLKDGRFAGDLGTVVARRRGPEGLARLLVVADTDPDQTAIPYPPWQTASFTGHRAVQLPPAAAEWIRTHVLNRPHPRLYCCAGLTTCQAHQPRPQCSHCRSGYCDLCTGSSWGQMHAAAIRDHSGSDLFWRDEHRFADGQGRSQVWIAPRRCLCRCRATAPAPTPAQASTPRPNPAAGPAKVHDLPQQIASNVPGKRLHERDVRRPRGRAAPLDGQLEMF
ncbi:hypothetical protein ACSNOI_03255 [Actinomadura kijaniata]|uniref:hypothetical protein n=1 Tax=Actinomadura kijaniata TaxID=46161 RepID=UPI003F1BBC9B